MADDTKSVLCGACRIPVEGPAEPDPQDTFSCPTCGNSDNFENVMASVKAFVAEAAGDHLKESMRKAARSSKFLNFSSKPTPKRDHPFVIDMQL